MKQRVLQRGDILAFRDGIGVDESDLPHIDLTVGYDVRACRSEVTVHPGPNAIDGLSDTQRHTIKIAQNITADLVRQGPDPGPTKGEVDGDFAYAARVKGSESRDKEGSKMCSAR